VVSFRLVVICAISYTDMFVYFFIEIMNLKVKLHVLIGCGEKMDPKLISFWYCVCAVMLLLVTCILDNRAHFIL
jgi:hypothetical protein